MIPKIIHQIWHSFDGQAMPKTWARFLESWHSLNAEFEHLVWQEAESREFVKKHYSWLLDLYDGYREPIQRVDLLRILLLHFFGGVCVDLDVECLKPISGLIEGESLLLVDEPKSHLHLRRHPELAQVVSTAFIASAPNQQLLADVIDEIQRSKSQPNVMDSTGLFALSRCLCRRQDRYGAKVVRSSTLFPVAAEACHSGQAYDLESWAKATQFSYGVHYWEGRWRNVASERRSYPCGIPAKVRHPSSESNTGSLKLSGPLVSCLMVSRGNLFPAKFAIECFLRQTYQHIELVIVSAKHDGDLRSYVENLGDNRIRYIPALGDDASSIGSLRNFAVKSATGEFLATWDDDDLYGEDRIAVGITLLESLNVSAVFNERISIWIPAQQKVFVTARHHWENSMIARRTALPLYPEINRGEDSAVVAELASKHSIALVDDPNLYLYVVWGGNTCPSEHFERFSKNASFVAQGSDYRSALSVFDRHVPVFDYLGWLEALDYDAFHPTSYAQLADEVA